jgi:CHAT domain-containing protein/tetratricopeptide (TPR) repeat protein
MARRFWTFAVLVLSAGVLAGLGCNHLRRGSTIQIPNTRLGRELARADYFAKLGNWEIAGPRFRELERTFQTLGDTRNALYARVSRYRAEIEYSDLQVQSAELTQILSRPDVQNDLALKQRCLETKGNVDLNFDGVSARSSFEELERVARQRKDWDMESRASGELGILAFLEGNPSQAKWRVLEAIGKAIFYRDVGAQIRYFGLMGQGMAENGRASEALWFLNRAIKIARESSDAGFPKIAISGKASALRQLGRYKEAHDVVEHGLDYARRNGYVGFQVDMLAQAGQLAVAEQQIPAAIEFYKQAATLAEGIRFNRGLAEVNSQLAALYQRAGELGKAEECARKSIEAHRLMREVYSLPHHLAVQARVQAMAGKLKEAQQTYETAERIVGTMLLNTPTPGIKRAVIASMNELFVGHFTLAVQLNDLRKAYDVIEDARGRVAADRLRSQEQREARTPPQIAAAERNLALLQIRLLDAQDERDRQDLSDSLISAESELTIRADTRFDVPLGKRPSLPDLQRVLGPDEAVLEYVLGENGSFCLWITRNKVHVAQLPDRKTIDQLVEAYLHEVMRQAPGTTTGGALFSAILGRVAEETAIRHLVIVPDGSLHRVPFAALSYGNPTNIYLVQTHTVSYTPSGTVLSLLRAKTYDRRKELLAVGNVPYKEPTPVAGSPSSMLFRGLDSLRASSFWSLPGTADEVNTIGSLLRTKDGVVLSGPLATETNFKRETQAPFTLIHLAVHGFADKVYPDRAGLVFGRDEAAGDDGLLQVREIRKLPLSGTSLVTLSACDTNVGRLEGGEGVSSIVYAFLYAGARTAVSSFWMLEDSTTSAFMNSFYTALSRGETKAAALRTAQLELLKRGGQTEKPFFWAAFNVIGDAADTIKGNAQ